MKVEETFDQYSGRRYLFDQKYFTEIGNECNKIGVDYQAFQQ